MTASKPYRIGATAYVLNAQGQILIVQLNHYKDGEWSLPSGGREDNETAQQNAVRETSEELGIKPEYLELVGISQHKMTYDFPANVDLEKVWAARKYRGQQKDQVVFKYTGDNQEFEIDTNELRRYMWCDISELRKYLVFPNQLQQTQKVLNEFGIK